MVLCGCTSYYGKVSSLNEADETIAIIEDLSAAEKMISLLESLPGESEAPEEVDRGVDHTLRIWVDGPGDSGMKVIKGTREEERPSGILRRYVRARVRNRITEITWISGWGERTGLREVCATTDELAEAVKNVGKYTSVYEEAPEKTGEAP